MLDLTDRFNPEASRAEFVARHGDDLDFSGEEDREASDGE